MLLSGGEGPLGSAKDAREQIAALMPSSAQREGFEYFVGCKYDAAREELALLAGTNSGHCAAFPVALEGDKCIMKPALFQMQGGHTSARPKSQSLDITPHITWFVMTDI